MLPDPPQAGHAGLSAGLVVANALCIESKGCNKHEYKQLPLRSRTRGQDGSRGE